MTVALQEDLCYDALLGTDLPDLWEIGKRLLYDELADMV